MFFLHEFSCCGRRHGRDRKLRRQAGLSWPRRAFSGAERIRGGKRLGIQIHGKKENFRLVKIRAYKTTEAIGPCDLVLIALKATNNDVLPDLIPPLLHETTALLLQNGLGNEEFLARHFGAERVAGGLCFICVNRVAPSVIEHFDYGSLTIGEFTGLPKPRTHNIASEFKRCGVVCAVVENLMRERWRKLVWNIPFNGLSIAAGGSTTRDILQDDSLRLSALGLMDEIIVAAWACGNSLPENVALEQMKRTETIGAYKPSTLLDFEVGRALEVETIWGEPLRCAQVAGATMPRLEQLYAVLKSLDGRRE